MNLTKDQILAAVDRPFVKVAVPEWGGDVYISVMTGMERDVYESELVDGKRVNYHNIRARMLVRCLTDENGDRLFSDDDIRKLGDKSGAVLDRLWDKARTVNGMSQKDVDELAGNSEGVPSGGSSSASA